MKPRLIIAAVIFSLLVVTVDQYLKSHLAVTVPNTGTFLGLPVANGLLAILHILVVSAGIGFLAIKVRQVSWQVLGIIMLISSLSNLADRLFLGAVIDYIYAAGVWFNLADAVITVGVILIVYKFMRS